MLRLLVLIVVAYLVYRGIGSLLGELRGAGGGGTFNPSPPPPPRVTVTVHREPTEELVACGRCGDRVPRSRTVAGEGGAVVCASCGKLPR
jgi:hypothetical protein